MGNDVFFHYQTRLTIERVSGSVQLCKKEKKLEAEDHILQI